MARQPEQLLVLAQAGERSALGELLEFYRNYLRLLARLAIDRRLQGKIDPSDVVQEPSRDAPRDFARFRGGSDGELPAWLRQVLAHNIATVVRHYQGTRRRDVRLEQQLRAELDRSSEA